MIKGDTEMGKLALTRRVGEYLILGRNDIKILICATRGNQVKLLIEAPDYISIFRQEIYDSIDEDSKPRHLICAPDNYKLAKEI